MQYRKLGNSDLEVSAVGMGCWAIVGDSTWGPQDAAATEAAIKGALDAGVNFFDTAEAYGDGFSEEILGGLFCGMREEVTIASKASPSHHEPAALRAACEASLRRLRTDYLDLYQLHWPSREVPFADTWETMMALVQEGKVRAAGVSNFGRQDLTKLLACGVPASDQLCYNMLFRAIEFEIQPLCVESGIGIICYSPLMQGLLTGKFSHADEVPEGGRAPGTSPRTGRRRDTRRRAPRKRPSWRFGGCGALRRSWGCRWPTSRWRGCWPSRR